MVVTQAQKDAATALLADLLDKTDATGKNVSIFNGVVVPNWNALADRINSGGAAALQAVGIDPSQAITLLNGVVGGINPTGQALRAMANAAAALAVSDPPVVVTPPSATPFTLVRTGQTFADFGSAHAAAQDGDTITVNTQTFNVSPDGFSIYKGLTVKSAVPGQRYKIVVAPNAAGAIGSGIGITPLYRLQKLGLSSRFAVTIQDAEICATTLTFVTGKAAVFLDCASGTAPCDLTLRNCYIHDFDQGVEAGNEYDPATRLSTVTIDSCDIEQTGDIASGDNNHCLYIGQIAALSLTNTTVKNVPGPGWTGPNYVNGSIDGPNYWPVGMAVKTRTKATTIDGCTLIGSANSNLVECGNGGDLLIQNCQIEQGQYTDGNALISYGRFITATESKDPTRLVANDGRTNRLRVLNCTLKNDCTSKPMQWIELSNTCTQAGAPAVTYQIGGNTFVDSPAGLAIDPTKGYPNLQPSQVFGIPLVVDGSVQTVAKAGQQQPPVTQPPVTQPPVTTPPTETAPAWYTPLPVNAWTSLTTFPSIYSQFQSVPADRANPDDIGGSYKCIYPTYGESAGYVTSGAAWPVAGVPKIAGVDPIPGYMDFRGDQGMCLADNASFKRRGKVWEGHFMVMPAQSGHGVGIINQIIVRHLQTGFLLDLTQPSFPPMGVPDATVNPKFQAWHGGPKGATQVGPGADGRPLSTHGYNSVVYDRKRNRVLWACGPAQVTGPVGNPAYCYDGSGDGWTGQDDATAFPVRFVDYFNTTAGAYPNGRNSAQCIDNDLDEIWNSYPNSPFANTVLMPRAGLAQGSTWQWVQFEPGNGDAQLGGASCISWAMEKEPWLVFFSEVNPYRCTILNRRYRRPNGHFVYWNVAFSPLNGDPANAIPTPARCDPSLIANVDGGIPATVAYDYEKRVFYACVFTLQPGVILGDVYSITLPAFDSSGADGAGSTFVQGIGGTEVVVPWITQKVVQGAGSAFQLPTRGNGSGPYYPSHKSMSFCPSPMRGLHFEHDPSQSPIFFKLAA